MAPPKSSDGWSVWACDPCGWRVFTGGVPARRCCRRCRQPMRRVQAMLSPRALRQALLAMARRRFP